MTTTQTTAPDFNSLNTYTQSIDQASVQRNANDIANNNLNAIYSSFFLFIFLIIAISIFDLIFRIQAIWRSARLNEKGWFVALFVFNTAGVLPIIYLLTSKDRYQKITSKEKSKA